MRQCLFENLLVVHLANKFQKSKSVVAIRIQRTSSQAAALKCVYNSPIYTLSSRWSILIRFLTSVYAFLASPIRTTFPTHRSVI